MIISIKIYATYFHKIKILTINSKVNRKKYFVIDYKYIMFKQ